MQAWGKERVAYDIFGMNANLKGFGTIADITTTPSTTQTPVISAATGVPAAGSGTAPAIVPVGTNKPASHSWKAARGRADGSVATSSDTKMNKPKQQRQKRGPRARNPKPSGDGSGGSTA